MANLSLTGSQKVGSYINCGVVPYCFSQSEQNKNRAGMTEPIRGGSNTIIREPST